MKRINSFVLSILIAAGILLCFMPLVNQSVYADDETVKITLHASSIEGDDWVDPIVIEAPKGTSYGDALTNYGNAHPEMGVEWGVRKSPFKKEGYGPIHLHYDNLHHTKSFSESTAYTENRVKATDIINKDIDVYVWHDIVLNRITIKRPVCGTEVSHTSDPYADQVNAPQLVYSDKIVAEYGKPAVWIQGPDNAGEAFQGTIEGGNTYYAYVIIKLKSDIGYQFDYVTGKMTVNGGKLEQWRMLNGSKVIFVASTEAYHTWGETKYTWGKDDKTVTASRPCTICGDEDSETADVVVTEKPATCTEYGEKTYTAEFANTAFEKQEKTVKTEDAHGHSEVEVPAVAATCTQGGKTAGSKCSECDKVFIAQKDTPALGHKEEVIPAIPATCTEGGKTAGKKCSVCKEILVAQEDTPALGHKWDAGKITTAATCTQDGIKTYTCTHTACTTTKTETIKATGHSETAIPAVAATCTKGGKTAGKKCSVCNEILEPQEDTPALGHKEVEIPAVEATCTHGGKTAGTKCSVCNEILVAQEDTAALGHAWGEPSYEWTKDGDDWKCTAARKCTRDESHKDPEAETVTANGVVTTEATEDAEGLMTYTATFEGDAFETQTETESIAPLSHTHTWGDSTYEWTKDGDAWKCTATRRCTKYESHTENETVTALGEETTAATEESEGLMTYTATFEGDAFETQTKTETIPKLPHTHDRGEGIEDNQSKHEEANNNAKAENVAINSNNYSGNEKTADELKEWNGTLDTKIPAVKKANFKAAKKKVTVSWTKANKRNLSKFSNIEVQVCKDKKFQKSNTKRIVVKKSKKTATVKGLKKGTYYVRVRNDKGSGAGKLVSKWSKVKKLKVK